MVVVKAFEQKGFKTPAPHERTLKVLLSPHLQSQVHDIAVGMTILPPGQSSSYHDHQDEIEVWYVVSGRGEAVVGGERFPIEPDTLIYTPLHTKHQFINSGEETMKVLWMYAPPGAERAVLDASFR